VFLKETIVVIFYFKNYVLGIKEKSDKFYLFIYFHEMVKIWVENSQIRLL